MKVSRILWATLPCLIVSLIFIKCNTLPKDNSQNPPDLKPPKPTNPRIIGITTDDPNTNIKNQVEALSKFKKRPMLRIVFDPGMEAKDYISSVKALAKKADILGLLIDSQEMASYDLPAIQERLSNYIPNLENNIFIWEVGNEINGEWLGKNVSLKLHTIYDYVKARGGKTACTFYYSVNSAPENDINNWIDSNIPLNDPMRKGLDYVLVSYYEDENNSHSLRQDEIDNIFHNLAQRFPNAKIGLGEVGWAHTIPNLEIRKECYQRWYSMRCSSPAFIGGGFFWEWRQLMVPYTTKDAQYLYSLCDE
jgi:hypothetical protein